MLLIFAWRHGAQNAYDGASKQTLDNEFGTSNEDECMIKILEKGDIQETEVGLSPVEREIRMADIVLFRHQSVKAPRMTVWVLVWLTKGFGVHTLF